MSVATQPGQPSWADVNRDVARIVAPSLEFRRCFGQLGPHPPPPFAAFLRRRGPRFLISGDKRDRQIVSDAADQKGRPQSTDEIGQVDFVPELDKPVPLRLFGAEDRIPRHTNGDRWQQRRAPQFGS